MKIEFLILSFNYLEQESRIKPIINTQQTTGNQHGMENIVVHIYLHRFYTRYVFCLIVIHNLVGRSRFLYTRNLIGRSRAILLKIKQNTA